MRTREIKHAEVACDEERWLYAAPVLLRQVEAAGIPLDSSMGITPEEHEELLDDPGILRVVFGATYDPEENAVAAYYGLEALSLRLASVFGSGHNEATWEDCVRWASSSPAARVDRNHNVHVARAVQWLVLDVVPDADEVVAHCRRPFDAWARKQDRVARDARDDE